MSSSKRPANSRQYIAKIEHDFMNVGQGLFANGSISITDRKNKEIKKLRWVYDCGSTRKTAVTAAVNKKYSRNDIIDIIFISHFDNDHVNGLIEILNTVKKVKNLILPFVPLWKRIIIGIELNLQNSKNDM